MRIIGASKATGGYPCPPGFNRRLRGVYRWFSGRPLSGHRYTDATGFRAGTFAVDISGHAAAYHYWPGYKKFLAIRLPVMAIPALAILAILGHWVIVAICLAITLAIVAKLAMAMAKDRGHRKNVVEPVAIAVAKILNKRHVHGHGHDWVAIPKDIRDNPLAMATVQLPVQWTPDKGEMARVANTVAKKLAIEDIVANWELAGARPYVEFSKPERPPTTVDLAKAMAMADTLSDSELAMGLGVRDRMATFSLELESPHLLIGAGSGAGKSVFLAWLVGQFMRRGYGVVVLDAKFISHMWLRQVPGVLYAAEDEELHNTLIWLAEEMLRRSRFVAMGGNPAGLVPLVVVAEEMNGATNRLRDHWNTTKETGVKGMSPALKALANLSAMGRELRIHILMAGQSMSSKATGGPESRESFGGRALARASVAQWRMLAPQIKPAPTKRQDPGRWHLVVGDTLKEFQVPFWNLKDSAVVPELIAWATGAAEIPDVVAMREGLMTQVLSRENTTSPAGSSPTGISLSAFAESRPGVTLTQLQNWRKRHAETFPEAVAEGAKGAQLYDAADLDLFMLTKNDVG